MARERALVKNAADPRQVSRAARKERDHAEAFAAAFKAVLATGVGRFVFAEILSRAGLDKTVYDHSGSTMYFNEGRRNFALELKATIIDIDEPAFELMDHEHRARQRAADRATDASHTARADDTLDPEGETS